MLMKNTQRWTALCCLVLGGCAGGGNQPALPVGGNDSSGGVVQDADATPTVDIVVDTDSQPSDGTQDSAACAALVATLSKEVGAQQGQACTAVIRLTVGTFVPSNWAWFCGPRVTVSESAAKEVAANALPKGSGLSGPGELMSDATPTDVFVFAVAPVDFGAVNVVSARTGALLLGATLMWSAAAQVYFPSSWHPASELGLGCAAVATKPVPHIYDFAGDSFPPTASEADGVLNALANTALWSVLAPTGAVADVVLVRLQHSVDGSSKATSTAEWIAIVDGAVGP